MLDDTDADAVTRALQLTNCRRWHVAKGDEAVANGDDAAAHRHYRTTAQLAKQIDAIERGA